MAGTDSLKQKLNDLALALRADHMAGRDPEPEKETEFWAMTWIWADHVATRWTRNGDYKTSEDLATETVTELVQDYPKFLIDLEHQYTTFLYEVVHRNYVDAVRAATRRPRSSWRQEADTKACPDESAEQLILRKERLKKVTYVLKTMQTTMNTKGRVMLFQVAGWITVEEARKILGLSRSEYFRQRDQLLKELGRQAS